MSMFEGRKTGGVIAVTICFIVLFLVVGGWIVAVIGQGNIQEGISTIIDLVQTNSNPPG